MFPYLRDLTIELCRPAFRVGTSDWLGCTPLSYNDQFIAFLCYFL
jgi:hypothetical protein